MVNIVELTTHDESMTFDMARSSFVSTPYIRPSKWSGICQQSTSSYCCFTFIPIHGCDTCVFDGFPEMVVIVGVQRCVGAQALQSFLILTGFLPGAFRHLVIHQHETPTTGVAGVSIAEFESN